MYRKLIGVAAAASVAGCGGYNHDTAVIEDTTVVVPATAPVPVAADTASASADTLQAIDVPADSVTDKLPTKAATRPVRPPVRDTTRM
jgi:hypothetical protein